MRAHLETVIETPTHIEIVEVIGVDTWDWVIDGLTTPIVNTHTVRINFTAEDQTTQNDVHIAQREDGSLGWFVDSGDPLQ